MKKITFIVFFTMLLFSLLYVISVPKTNAANNPTLVEGNPTCADLGYLYEFKIDPPNPGLYSMGNGTVTRTSTDNKYVDRISTIGLDAVIVKGGNAANVYVYNVESTGDNNLVSPINASGLPADLSHVSFCYDYEVEVNKTANTSFIRQYLWTIEKQSNKTGLTLNLGETGTVNYFIHVYTSGYVDKDWLVTGTVNVYNPDPQYPAIIDNIFDLLSGYTSIQLYCGLITFPYQMNAGETLSCQYQKYLSGPINTINTVVVHTNSLSKVGGGIANADVIFGLPTYIVDEEVNIIDSMYTPTTGRTCSIQNILPCTFLYTINIGPFTQIIPDFEMNNIATVTTIDSQTSATANARVFIHLLPPPPVGSGNTGCTFTQGYWKTHSKYGPAKKTDLTRNQIGENTLFFLSNKSRYTILQTAPKQGNVYYILAHQYIAAKLNILNGASTTPGVNLAINFAEMFFGSKTLNSIFTPIEKISATSAASILDQYNNGLVGPGHCSS